MAGENPYIDNPQHPLPKNPYRLTFMPMNVTVEVDPAKLPLGETGQGGSVLDIALAHGIDIEHTCGGVVACSTCHCIVRQGMPTLPESTEDEEDMLDNAPGLEINSRLSCQAVPNGDEDIVVEIPGWNRIAVKVGG